ncbi:MAG: hypothetical protein ACI4JY_03965 [Oscillospiraceae bacterium]
MRSLFTHFRKILTSRGFYLCIFLTVLLLFSAEIYTDYRTTDRYSVFRTLTSFSAEERLALGEEMCSVRVLSSALNGWFTLFTPIAAAFCFIPIICTEREENAVRFQMFRSSKIKYNAAQFLAGIISSGTAVTLGYLIFSAVVMITFPDISQFNETTAEHIKMWSQSFPALLTRVWCFGAFWGIPAMLLSSVIRNKYIVMCLPFFLKYGLSQAYLTVITSAYKGDSNETLLKITILLCPDGLLGSSPWYEKAAVFGGLAIIFFTAYMIITAKRGDCGA